eukprot:scaffold298_cov247-Pinguiococcus_pyrenoidosus.AAC.43
MHDLISSHRHHCRSASKEDINHTFQDAHLDLLNLQASKTSPIHFVQLKGAVGTQAQLLHAVLVNAAGEFPGQYPVVEVQRIIAVQK